MGIFQPDLPLPDPGDPAGDPLSYLAAASVAPAAYSSSPTLAAFTADDFDAVDAKLRTHELYVTSLSGANNDFVVVARADDTSPLTIALVDPGENNAALSVSYSAPDITVNLATNGSGTITSTANDVVAALNGYTAGYDATPGVSHFNPGSGHAEARGLVTAQVAPGNTGAGVVTALSSQGLGAWGGNSPTVDCKLQTSADASTWSDVASFTQATAVGAAERKVFTGLERYNRWVPTAGQTGTAPGLLVAFSISAKTRRVVRAGAR